MGVDHTKCDSAGILYSALSLFRTVYDTDRFASDFFRLLRGNVHLN